MEIPKEHRGRFFYHFTHIDNIASIVEQGGLLSTNQKKLRGIGHHNIANTDIQSRRSEMTVPAGPGGVVHDYVPFYFASTNPMLLGLLNRKTVDQPCICFLAVPIEKLLEENVLFTDASANTAVPPNFYSDPGDLARLDWERIDSRKWGSANDEEMHARMAEVLVPQKVPLDWIASYIVFDDAAEREIRRCYRKAGLESPAIAHRWFNERPFYFTKFALKGRKTETLVTGPLQLRKEYRELIDSVIERRKRTPPEAPRFPDMDRALARLETDFCSIPELSDIYGLETVNPDHHETVSDHTKRVAEHVEDSAYFAELDPERRRAVRLAAYLHDIGKGPKEKWPDGVQPAYQDHPADAIPMLRRILTEDFARLSETDIRRICLLVVYHDLLGDIVSKGRSREELFSLDLSEQDLYMLAALTEADVRAIREEWWLALRDGMRALIREALGEEEL